MITWLNFKKAGLNTNDDPIGPTPLFNNEDISFKGRTFFFQNWVKKGIKYMHDIWENGHFKTLDVLEEKIGNKGALLFNYFALKNAVMKSKAFKTKSASQQEQTPNIDLSKMRNKIIRTQILKDRALPPSCISTWKKK